MAEDVVAGMLRQMFFPNGQLAPYAVAGLQQMLREQGFKVSYDQAENIYLEKKVLSKEESGAIVQVPSLIVSPDYVFPRPFSFVLYEKQKGAGHDAFNVYNSHGETIMTARGKHFSFGKTITISDMRGQKLIKVVEKMLHLHKTYHFENAKGKTIASAQKHIIALKSTFTVSDSKTNKTIYRIAGNWGHYNFDVLNKDKQILARIREKDSALNAVDKTLNTYEIYCEPRVDTLMVLAMAIMCDCVDND